ncbi:MAG: hypothetical protein OEZ58_18010, partial [Gammaproteobacteria bacterium]|nr:hypothetical protein [Gammaproteobacteria bacterium]
MSEAHTDIDSANKKHCIACYQSIHPHASVCPFCQNKQTRGRLSLLSNILKWSGGITAVVSVVITMSQVNQVYNNWRHTQDAVSELISAAKLQAQARHYQGAWKMLDKALQLQPGSPDARVVQVDVAMEWLRNARANESQSFTQTVETIQPALYRGATNLDKNKQSDVFAHLGWADYLLVREGKSWLNVDEQFEKSLELNPDNALTHAMYGHWIANNLNKKNYEKDKLDLAIEHFDQALKQPSQHLAYIRSLQFNGMKQTKGTKAKTYLLIQSYDAMLKNEDLSGTLVSKILNQLRILKNASSTNAQQLFSEYHKIQSIDYIKLYNWLSQRYYQHYNKKYFDEIEQPVLIAGLTGLSGDYQKALELYNTYMMELQSN